jgi:hypothetical protein
MLVLGLTMVVLGFVDDVADADAGKGATFWVLGVLLTTPAFYYSIRMAKALQAERQQMLPSEVYFR